MSRAGDRLYRHCVSVVVPLDRAHRAVHRAGRGQSEVAWIHPGHRIGEAHLERHGRAVRRAGGTAQNPGDAGHCEHIDGDGLRVGLARICCQEQERIGVADVLGTGRARHFTGSVVVVRQAEPGGQGGRIGFEHDGFEDVVVRIAEVHATPGVGVPAEIHVDTNRCILSIEMHRVFLARRDANAFVKLEETPRTVCSARPECLASQQFAPRALALVDTEHTLGCAAPLSEAHTLQESVEPCCKGLPTFCGRVEYRGILPFVGLIGVPCSYAQRDRISLLVLRADGIGVLGFLVGLRRRSRREGRGGVVDLCRKAASAQQRKGQEHDGWEEPTDAAILRNPFYPDTVRAWVAAGKA